MPILDRRGLKDWSRERKLVLKREDGNGCRTRGKRSRDEGTSSPRERRRRERLEKLLREREDARRMRRIALSLRRLRRRSARRRLRLSAEWQSSERRSERRLEVTEVAEIALSLAAGAELVEMTDQDVAMMDLGEEMTDPGEMEPRDQVLEVLPGDPAVVDGGTGSRRRMRSGDPGVAVPEVALLQDAMIVICAEVLLQDVDLLLERTEMLGPGDVEVVLPPGEMIEEAVTRGQLEVVLHMKTGKYDVEDHLLVVMVEIVEDMIAVIAKAGMVVAVPGEEEAEIVMVAIVKCVVEDPGMMIVEDPLVMMVAVPLRDVTDLPVMMDLETGDEDLLVMIVTCAVDPLEMKDLALPLRDPQENKTKAGPLLRPSVNSQLSSRLSARARFIRRVHVRPSELTVS